MSVAARRGGKNAVVLVSGGLDSATVLAIAKAAGFRCHALSVAYGQRHAAELGAARRLCRTMGVETYRVLKVNLDAVGGSALTDARIEVPLRASVGIPVTYVPARNTLFLSLALGLAEVVGARDIFIGVNAVDYSGYPDCRPRFIRAFERLSRWATRDAAEQGQGMKIHAPLMRLGKAKIIKRGIGLGVDYARTVSCYRADRRGRACGRCDACRLRREGFRQAKRVDPTRYVTPG